ncbi:MAG: DUF167 domain-containing protein [Deltaproteobacteria bacterium]|nr:DUF167 domain-containing protein [Deltaproteobacteria bacterium]
MTTARPVYATRSRQGWRLSVWVQPGAKKTELAGMHGDFLKIRLQAPAVDNKANAALTAFVAKALGLRPGQVSLDQGLTSRQKSLLLHTEEEPEWDLILTRA